MSSVESAIIPSVRITSTWRLVSLWIAASVAAVLNGLVKAPRNSKVVCVLSGGNVNLQQLKGLKWN